MPSKREIREDPGHHGQMVPVGGVHQRPNRLLAVKSQWRDCRLEVQVGNAVADCRLDQRVRIALGDGAEGEPHPLAAHRRPRRTAGRRAGSHPSDREPHRIPKHPTAGDTVPDLPLRVLRPRADLEVRTRAQPAHRAASDGSNQGGRCVERGRRVQGLRTGCVQGVVDLRRTVRRDG
jgi:hypothetical protein